MLTVLHLSSDKSNMFIAISEILNLSSFRYDLKYGINKGINYEKIEFLGNFI